MPVSCLDGCVVNRNSPVEFVDLLLRDMIPVPEKGNLLFQVVALDIDKLYRRLGFLHLFFLKAKDMFEHMIVVIQPAASEHLILDSYHESAGGDVETGENNIEGTTDGRAVLIEKLLKEYTDKQNGAAQKEDGTARKRFEVFLFSHLSCKEHPKQRVHRQQSRHVKYRFDKRRTSGEQIPQQIPRSESAMLCEARTHGTKQQTAQRAVENKDQKTKTEAIKHHIFQTLRPSVEIGDEIAQKGIEKQYPYRGEYTKAVKTAFFQRIRKEKKG